MEADLNSFRWIWIAPSIILGLGVTRLLSDAVIVFRSRGRARLDWVPLGWAGCIFVWQVQYLWAVIELPNLAQTWTRIDFVLLLGLSLLLFIAAALVLPDSVLEDGESLSDSFRRDGRWALLALSGWGCNALAVNWVMFGLSPLSYEAGLLTVIIVLPVTFLAISSRRVREGITILNLVLTLWAAWQFSPKSY